MTPEQILARLAVTVASSPEGKLWMLAYTNSLRGIRCNVGTKKLQNSVCLIAESDAQSAVSAWHRYIGSLNKEINPECLP